MPEELKLLNEWQKRLGLDDWFITLETHCDPENMSVQCADGCTNFIEHIKAAKIQIVEPKKRAKEDSESKIICLRAFDFEETLVHELLHLKFSLLERGDDWEGKLQLRVLHQLIDDIARALIDARNAERRNESVQI